MKNPVRYSTVILAGAAALSLAACGNDMPMGPGSMGMQVVSPGAMPGKPAFMSMSPAGGDMGVSTGASVTFRWDTPMGVGMEQFVDLHQGSLGGPTVPMGCIWSADQTQLTCTPTAPLRPGTRYVVHVGGGMMDANGQPIDIGQYGPGFGGQWIMGGMMGGFHAGTPWGGLGAGWRHSNGSFGMWFSFTTG